MGDFFDQNSGNDSEYDDDDRDMDNMERPAGASILVNGSHVPVEEGADFLATVKGAALNAGFGKFKAFLNGQEIRPSSAPATISTDHRIEIRPYDEAG